MQLWRLMFAYWLTQRSRAAASASGSPTCSCLPSAAGINGKATSKLRLAHMTFVQEQLIHFPPSLGQPLTCIWCNKQRRAKKKKHTHITWKSLSGKESFLFKATSYFSRQQKNEDGREQRVCKVVEQKEAGFDSLTSVMEEYSSTAVFSSSICLLFCSKKREKKG